MTTPEQDLSLALLAHRLPEGDGPPAEIMLLPAGVIRSGDKRGPWQVEDAQAVVTASMAAGHGIVLDFVHQTQLAKKTGGDAPAAGWITDMAVKDGAIWGSVNWTKRGKEALANRDYRFISPAFFHDQKSGAIRKIVSASLVNDPAIDTLPALAHKEISMDKPSPAATAAAPAASRADAIAALREKHQGDEATLALLSHAIEPETAAPAAAAEPDPSKFAPIGVVKDLSQQLASLRAEVASGKAADAVAAAEAESKVSPAMREWALELASKDPEAFAAFVKNAPKLVADGVADALAKPAGGSGLSADQLAICTNMGLDPVAYAKSLQEADHGS